MVEWSKWLSAMSGSLQVSESGSNVPIVTINIPPNTPHEMVTVKVGPRLNPEFAAKIEKILSLAISFDSTMDAVSKIERIRTDYVKSGILTKDEMLFLNRMYKLFTFEAKYHPDKQTTVGRIKEILGGLNG